MRLKNEMDSDFKRNDQLHVGSRNEGIRPFFI